MTRRSIFLSRFPRAFALFVFQTVRRQLGNILARQPVLIHAQRLRVIDAPRRAYLAQRANPARMKVLLSYLGLGI